MSAAHALSNMAAWSAQAAVLIAAGTAVAWIFRLRAPRVRLVYGQALLAVCLMLPVLEPWQPAADSQISVTSHAAQPVASTYGAGRSLPWRRALLIALAAGCATRLIWLALGFSRLRRYRRTSRPFAPLPFQIERLRNSLASQTEFLLSQFISGPVTFGLGRPVVVLPLHFADLPVDIQESVACHELLHVRRHDWIVTVVEELVRAALWFHPAIWWLINQVQLTREQTVDAEVVRFTRNRAQYLNALLAMAGDQPSSDLAPATLFLRKRHLKNRVALLLKEVTMSKRMLTSFCAASCAMLLAAGWLALHSFPLQAAPVPQEQSDPKLLHSVAPQYPPDAIEKRIEGAVVMEVHISTQGNVSDAHVLSGPEELRRSALEAVLQWHYSPKAMTLPAITEVTMEFKLPRNGAPVMTTRPAPPEGPPFQLKGIEVEGLSPAARDELLQRLPVHTGDTVNADVLHTVIDAVRAFDDHLIVLNKRSEGILQIAVAPPSPVVPQGNAPQKIRVGGGVQQAKLLVKVPPVYPLEAKAQGIQGLVRLEATLDKAGNVANLKVMEGDPTLAAAAIDAVRQWQYQTTLLNGDPVEVITQIDVNFTLAK